MNSVSGYSGFYDDYANELQFKRESDKELGIGLYRSVPVAWGTPGVSVLGSAVSADAAELRIRTRVASGSTSVSIHWK